MLNDKRLICICTGHGWCYVCGCTCKRVCSSRSNTCIIKHKWIKNFWCPESILNSTLHMHGTNLIFTGTIVILIIIMIVHQLQLSYYKIILMLKILCQVKHDFWQSTLATATIATLRIFAHELTVSEEGLLCRLCSTQLSASCHSDCNTSLWQDTHSASISSSTSSQSSM